MTSSEEISSPSSTAPSWTMASALQFITESGPVFNELGLCPALAGGVLLKGQSDKDLDVHLIPRLDSQVTVDKHLVATLATGLGLKFERWRPWSPGVVLLKYSAQERQIDFFVSTPKVMLEYSLVSQAVPCEPIEGPRPYIDPQTNRPTRGRVVL